MKFLRAKGLVNLRMSDGRWIPVSAYGARGNCVLIITEIGGFIGVVQSICHPFATAIFKIITEQRKGSEHAEQSADSLPIFYL